MLTRVIEITDLQQDVERASRSVWLDAKELNSYRRHNGAREFLRQPEVLDDIEQARDYLSHVLDDLRGKS